MFGGRLYLLTLIWSVCFSISSAYDKNKITTGSTEANLGLEKYGNSIYLFAGAVQVTRLMASLVCNKRGMRLVSIETKEEEAFVQSKLPANFLPVSYGQVFAWTSGIVFGTGFIWESTGKLVRYTDWGYGQPNDKNGLNNYIMLVYDEENTELSWQLKPDNYTGYIVCEAPVVSCNN